LDFLGLLAAVENASPVAAADVLAERLTDALGASEVPSSLPISAAERSSDSATPPAKRPAEPKGAKRPSVCPWREARTAAL
jgi:hypothetical protein